MRRYSLLIILLSLLANTAARAQTEPKTAEDYKQRAFERRNSDTDGAIADYTKAIELEPQNSEAYEMRALLRSGKRDIDGALADYTKVIELKPQDASTYLFRSELLERKGDYDGMLADLTKFIELKPGYSDAYRRRAALRELLKGDIDGALADYTRIIELEPGDADSYVRRAQLRKLKKDYDGAIADLTRHIELEPGRDFVYSMRAELRALKQDLDGAVEDFTRAIELNPKNEKGYAAWAYRLRGEIKQKQGKAAEAQRDFDAANKLSPSIAPPVLKEPVGEDRPGTLLLRVEITKYSMLLLNGQSRDTQTRTPYGSVNDPRGLREKLAKILRERETHPGPDVHVFGTNEVERTVFIKAPETMKYGQVVKVIDAVKAAGASPVGLQVDGLEPKAKVPEEKPSASISEEKPEARPPWDTSRVRINIPAKTPPEPQEQVISSRDSIVISIPRDGEIYMGEVIYRFDIKALNHPERKRLMSDLKKEIEKRTDEERIVYIKASVDVSYRQVVGMIDLIRDPEAGGATRVGLVADRKRTLDSEVPKKRRRRRAGR